VSDLELAITYYQQAVSLTPANSPDLPSRLNNLGNGFSNRYVSTGATNDNDLELAIGYYQQAVSLIPTNSPDLPSILNNLGNGLRNRYARTGARLERSHSVL